MLPSLGLESAVLEETQSLVDLGVGCGLGAGCRHRAAVEDGLALAHDLNVVGQVVDAGGEVCQQLELLLLLGLRLQLGLVLGDGLRDVDFSFTRTTDGTCFQQSRLGNAQFTVQRCVVLGNDQGAGFVAIVTNGRGQFKLGIERCGQIRSCGSQDGFLDRCLRSQ